MNTNTRQSIYGQYIHQQIDLLALNGGGVWDFKDLAKKLGVSANHNFRKRLRTAEAMGQLTITYGLVGAHSVCYLYNIPDLSTYSPEQIPTDY